MAEKKVVTERDLKNSRAVLYVVILKMVNTIDSREVQFAFCCNGWLHFVKQTTAENGLGFQDSCIGATFDLFYFGVNSESFKGLNLVKS